MTKRKAAMVLAWVVSLVAVIPAWAAPPQPGEVVINEIMQNPAAVSDANGEWFEVVNVTGSTLDLDGCVVSDEGTNSFTIASNTQIASGQYFVFCTNADSGTNGGFSCDYEWPSFAVANGDDEIIITCGTDEIDRVEYDGGPTWPDPTGASMQYTVPGSGNTSNNVGSNWAETTSSTYGDGDYGTPGMRNDDWMGPSAVELQHLGAGSPLPVLTMTAAFLLVAAWVLMKLCG